MRPRALIKRPRYEPCARTEGRIWQKIASEPLSVP
jgi:hypothetical protein